MRYLIHHSTMPRTQRRGNLGSEPFVADLGAVDDGHRHAGPGVGFVVPQVDVKAPVSV